MLTILQLVHMNIHFLIFYPRRNKYRVVLGRMVKVEPWLKRWHLCNVKIGRKPVILVKNIYQNRKSKFELSYWENFLRTTYCTLYMPNKDLPIIDWTLYNRWVKRYDIIGYLTCFITRFSTNSQVSIANTQFSLAIARVSIRW